MASDSEEGPPRIDFPTPCVVDPPPGGVHPGTAPCDSSITHVVESSTNICVR